MQAIIRKTIGKTKQLLSDRSGTALLEFIMVAGVLLLLTFAMMDFGLFLNQKLVLTHAAREGARRAAIDGGASERARNKIAAQLEAGNISADDADISIKPNQANYGTLITVSVSARYQPVTAVLRLLGAESMYMSAQMTSRSEKLQEGEH